MVNEQPKLGDPGVTDIPLDGGPEEELGGSPEVKEKPSYVTRAVAARQRAGLVVKSERGVEVRTGDMLVIDDRVKIIIRDFSN